MLNHIQQSHIISILSIPKDWYYFMELWWMVEASPWTKANGY